jgi:sodium/potassium-transporting ATPase subunit alpha
MSIHKRPHATGPLTSYIKGAPEVVYRLCSRVLTGRDGESAELTDEYKKAYDDTYEHIASLGHRVLGFAELLLSGDQYPENFVFDKKAKNYPLGDFVFVGLASLQDPPKHGVRKAISTCRTAGIKVMMVTGDHPLTAEAIARKINLMIGETRAMVAKQKGRAIEEIGETEFNSIVAPGAQIDSLTDSEWGQCFLER